MRKFSKYMMEVILIALLGVQAQGAVHVREKDCGISMDIGDAHVELAVASPTALRLTVSYDGSPDPSPTSFLNPERKTDVPWEKVEKDGFVGICSSAGTLLISTETGKWSLINSKGEVVVPPTKAIGKPVKNLRRGEQELSIEVGLRDGYTSETYGSGTSKQHQLLSKGPEGGNYIGKGYTRIPYCWSPAGYAMMAVSADEDQWAQRRVPGDPEWIFPGTRGDLYLMPAANLKEAAQAYADLCGTPAVPPRWSFGYLQSRWGWVDRTYIEDTLKQFRERKHPVDAFIYDFEWYNHDNDYRISEDGATNFFDFGWNTELFPEPAKQIAEYKAQGVRFVGIRKPRVSNTEMVKLMHEKGWALRSRDWRQEGDKNVGKTMEARALNFRLPEVRSWYAEQIKPLLETGIDGWWNDEGEVSQSCFYYWRMAQEHAMEKYRDGQRLWTLNRGFTPGMQRFGAAAWTGDIFSSWKFVDSTPTELLNWSLAGMFYGGCDIGGFWKPSPEDKKFPMSEEEMPHLLTRWMQCGVFYPLMRTHSVRAAIPHFPWNRGEETEKRIRESLNLRYRLIPYYYSLAHHAYETSMPLMRPLVMEFPDDTNVVDMADQWFMGEGLMVAPILTVGNERDVYLPEGYWCEFQKNRTLKGNQTMHVKASMDETPVYVRAGTILPLGPVVQHTGEMPGGPLEVQIYPGRDATFTLVEDDGLSNDYKKGKVRRTTFVWKDAAKELVWKIDGPYAGKDIFKTMKVTVFAEKGILQGDASLNGADHITF